MRRGRRALMQQGAVMSGAPSAVNNCGAAPGAAPSSVENSSNVAASSGSVRNCFPSKRPRKNCVGLTGARRGASAAALAARTISRGMGTAREASARAQRSNGVADALSELRNASARPLTAARGGFFYATEIAGFDGFCAIFTGSPTRRPATEAGEARVPGCGFRRSPVVRQRATQPKSPKKLPQKGQ